MPDKLPGRRFSPRPTAHKGEGWDWAAGYCSAMAWACAHGLELFYEPRLERRRVDLHLLFSEPGSILSRRGVELAAMWRGRPEMRWKVSHIVA